MYLLIYTQTGDKLNSAQPSTQKIQGKAESKLSAVFIYPVVH